MLVARISARYGPFTVAQALKRLELGPRCRRNSNGFAFFISRAYGPRERTARLGGGVERKQRRGLQKKQKKKYAIRDSNPENLLGRQKCYPYTNGVFFSRAHTDGCAATRADFAGNVAILGTQKETRGLCCTPARVHASYKHILSCLTLTSTGTTVSSLRIDLTHLCAAGISQILKLGTGGSGAAACDDR